jgi:hypothetical protein
VRTMKELAALLFLQGDLEEADLLLDLSAKN